MTPKTVGVLAEDKSDCEVVSVLIHRLREDPIGVLKFGSEGAANLVRKVEPHLRLWLKRGCTDFILVHDLDRDKTSLALNDRDALFARLDRLFPEGIDRRLICIPVEELEAWFWADQAVLEKVARGNPVKAHHHPHQIVSPKERLKQLSKHNGKTRFSTNDNAELAQTLDLDVCAKRCPEFAELRTFILGL